MGIGTSRPSTEDNIERKRILDTILQFMIKNTDLIDMYALASPKLCQRYTIFTSTSLEKYFKKLQLYPTKGADGKFYFQRLDKLAQMPSAYKTAQKTACLELSRYFVRILHVFASVSLTILDVEIPKTEGELNSLYTKNQTRRARNNAPLNFVPFMSGKPRPSASFWGFQQAQEQAQTQAQARMTLTNNDPRNVNNSGLNDNDNNGNPGPLQRGGVLPPPRGYVQYELKNSDYDILNDALEYYDSKYFRFVGTSIMVPIESLFNPPNQIEQQALATQRQLYIPTQRASISSITLFTGSNTATSKTFRFVATLSIEKEGSKYKITLKIQSPVKATQMVHFSYIAVGIPPTYNGMQLQEYLAKIVDKLLKKKTLTSQNTRKNITVKNLPENTNATIDDYFKIKSILSSINPKENPIKAYCVARSAQLLSPGDGGRTQICDKDFTLLGKSLPKGSIMSAKGMFALYRLFFDVFEDKPKKSSGVQAEYDTFAKGMEALYTGKELPTTASNIARITNVSNQQLCTSARTGKLYIKDKDVIQQMKMKATNLIDIQSKHIPRAMIILRKLFVINGKEPIVLQPEIESGGITAVEAVAAEARTLLVEYYTDCEIGYREGVDLLAGKVQANPAIISTV